MSAPNFIRLTIEGGTAPILVNLNDVRSITYNRGGGACLNFIQHGGHLGGHVNVVETLDDIAGIIASFGGGRFWRVDPS